MSNLWMIITIIDTDYLKKPIKSNFIELVHSFEDATETEAYSYSGADI